MFALRMVSFAAFCLAACCSGTARAQSTMHIAAEIGITAESTVIADLQASAETMLLRLDQATAERQVLALARQAVQDAIEEVAATNGESAEAQQDLNNALASLESAQHALFDLATNGFAASAIAALNNWDDVSTRKVPAEFRVLVMSDADWNKTERAYRAELRCLRRGDTLDAEHAAWLGNLRAEIAVTQAASRLQLNLASTQAVFQSYDDPPSQ